ncbi:HET-domain-containing protein [Xylaria digitata]|nr:HET-domain-containing protein [Xylaria digitata]
MTESNIEAASTMYRIRSTRDQQGLQLGVMSTKIEPKFYIRFFPHLQLGANTSSSTTLDLALHWYQSCCSSHPLCSRQSQRCPGWLPCRLLDIGSQGETCWKLVVISQDVIAPAPYDAYEDKACEIPQMRSIYNNVVCNLAASASDDPHGGLFRARDTTAVAPGLVAVSSGALRGEMYHVVDMSYQDGQILVANLLGCLLELKCEGFPYIMPQSFCSVKSLDSLWAMRDARRPSSSLQDDPQKGLSTPALCLWNNLVREYSNYALTLPEDRLLAFSGVADLFREIIGDQYLTGLWRSNLLHLLDWWVNQPRSRASEGHRAPSWSWASVDRPIRLRFGVAQSIFLVSVSAMETPPESGTTLSNVYLRLMGSLSLSTQHKQPMHCALISDTLGITLGVPGLFYFLYLQTSRHKAFPHSPGQCATEVSCLLLEPVLCTVPVVYRRVGHCTVADADDISKLGLQVDERGLASSQGSPDSIEIAII